MSAVVAALAGLTVLLAVPRPVRLPGDGPLRQRFSGAAAVLAAAATAWSLLQLSVAPVLIGILVGATAATRRALRRRRVRQAADRRRAMVLAVCEGLAADLASGLAPQQALRSMSQEWPELQPIADAATIGADVPAAFRALSEVPGSGMLRAAAAAWNVAQRSGAGLASAVGLAADTVRAERATARVVATELSAALATARLLALLPVGILVLGRGMGGDPVGFLLGTTGGQVCLALGLTLAWTGSVWLERIGDQVEQP